MQQLRRYRPCTTCSPNMPRKARSVHAFCTAILLGAALSADAAVVSNLTVRARKGQVFITFSETTGSTVTYQVFRSTSTISSVSTLRAIARLPQGSTQ